MACVGFHQDFIFCSCHSVSGQNVIFYEMMLLGYPGSTVGTEFLTVYKQRGFAVRF